MEAATPLNPARLRTLGDRLVIDSLVVDDECAARLVREREEAGDDTARLVVDAISIGARVLDREQAGANADFVKTEFEKASADLQREFGDQARAVTEQLDVQLRAVFADGDGRLAKELAKHFSDDSAGAVQHKVREIVAQIMASSREEMLRQFSSDGDKNPLADFKAATIRTLRDGGEAQRLQLESMTGRMVELEKQLQGLRSEKEKLEEIAAVQDKSTAKGRPYEEAVADAIDSIATAQGDVSDAVGDLFAATGKTGDVLVSIEAAGGPARGRIVFEAKNRRLSRPAAMEELDQARAVRDAQFAVLVVPNEEKLPARTHELREYNGDKLIVAFDPEDGSTLGLEVAYSLARARVLMSRGEDEGLDVSAIHDTAQRALGAMEDVRSIKQKLTGAHTQIDGAETVLNSMADRVRELLEQVMKLTAGAARDDC
jgi:hypothetical protein